MQEIKSIFLPLHFTTIFSPSHFIILHFSNFPPFSKLITKLITTIFLQNSLSRVSTFSLCASTKTCKFLCLYLHLYVCNLVRVLFHYSVFVFFCVSLVHTYFRYRDENAEPSMYSDGGGRRRRDRSPTPVLLGSGREANYRNRLVKSAGDMEVKEMWRTVAGGDSEVYFTLISQREREREIEWIVRNITVYIYISFYEVWLIFSVMYIFLWFFNNLSLFS